MIINTDQLNRAEDTSTSKNQGSYDYSQRLRNSYRSNLSWSTDSDDEI